MSADVETRPRVDTESTAKNAERLFFSGDLPGATRASYGILAVDSRNSAAYAILASVAAREGDFLLAESFLKSATGTNTEQLFLRTPTTIIETDLNRLRQKPNRTDADNNRLRTLEDVLEYRRHIDRRSRPEARPSLTGLFDEPLVATPPAGKVDTSAANPQIIKPLTTAEEIEFVESLGRRRNELSAEERRVYEAILSSFSGEKGALRALAYFAYNLQFGADNQHSIRISGAPYKIIGIDRISANTDHSATPDNQYITLEPTDNSGSATTIMSLRDFVQGLQGRSTEAPFTVDEGVTRREAIRSIVRSIDFAQRRLGRRLTSEERSYIGHHRQTDDFFRVIERARELGRPNDTLTLSEWYRLTYGEYQHPRDGSLSGRVPVNFDEFLKSLEPTSQKYIR